MKKSYTKPKLFFDSFELSQSIASGCSVIANFQYGACAMKVTDTGVELNIFTSAIAACEWQANDGAYNGICYDVPSDSSSLFTS